MLFSAVSWVLKVEQVYLPPDVKIMLTHIPFFPILLLFINCMSIAVEPCYFIALQVLELIAPHLLLSKGKFVGIFILMGLLLVLMGIC
jgi:hypothetical protein